MPAFVTRMRFDGECYGRQGPETRTHIASPETVAASAVMGRIVGVDQLPMMASSS